MIWRILMWPGKIVRRMLMCITVARIVRLHRNGKYPKRVMVKVRRVKPAKFTFIE